MALIKSGDVIDINLPAVQRVIITKAVGDHFEGWLNDNTLAANYFTLYQHPQAGWLGNFGTTYKKKLTAVELAAALKLI